MYRIPEVEDIEGIDLVYSTMEDGNMSVRYGEEEEVSDNIEHFLEASSFDNDSIVFTNVSLHSNDIVEVDSHYAEMYREHKKRVLSDCVLTQEVGLGLMLVVADCLPVVVYDPRSRTLALAHLGKLGTQKYLLPKLLDRMCTRYDAKKEDLIIIFGPAVRAKSDLFEELDPNRAAFDFESDGWKKHIDEIEDGYLIDTVGYNYSQLEKCGVDKTQVIDCGVDTCTDERFFSHKRDYVNGVPDQGRFACVVKMV